MTYSEIRKELEKHHADKFKFERWITELEVEIISNEFKGYPDCFESGTANGLSSYFFSQVCGMVYTYDPFNRPKIWDLLPLTYSGVVYNEASFSSRENGVVKRISKDRKAIFIDGDHTYESCKADWDVVAPFLTKEDVVVFHDVLGISAVRKFTNELLETGLVNGNMVSDNKRRGILSVKLK